MAELEALSNKELRQKCIEFGMPNVPVTDSSRKILIKRLEAVMSGKPIATTPSKNKRRETMLVSQSAEVTPSPKMAANNVTKQSATNNRPSRRTISVPERHVTTTTTVSEPEFSDVSPDRVETERVKSTTKTPEKPTTLYPKLPTKEPSPKPQVLSKTGVVTTSYVRETTPMNKTYADPEETDLVDDYVVEKELVETTTSNLSKFSYEPVSESKVITSAPLAASLCSSKRYSSLDSYDYNKSNYLASTTEHQSFLQPFANYSDSLSPTEYTKAYEAEVGDEVDYVDEDDDVVLVEESPIKGAETPFLSQFARNLEILKATPLRHSIGPTKISPPKTSLRNRTDAYYRRTVAAPFSNINTRHTIKPINNRDYTIRTFLLSMEEKYHLKQSLILISVFILAVFIYVFFIQSV